MTDLRFDHIGKTFGGKIAAVSDLSLHIADGEFLVLVGPSGCGKTTLLRMVAGLEDISEGRAYLGERILNDIPPQHRDVAMVFQNYSLYPHMTVRRNIDFPLRLRHMKAREREERVLETARLLGLVDYLDRRPRELSGGQRQRVAMGRAMVREPQLFLLDEPLSSLDAKLREEMRGEIRATQRRFGVTTVYVTHDQIEAMTMGDRVAVMKNGCLLQVDQPSLLYRFPQNLFVADFIGSPSMNLVTATLQLQQGTARVIVGDQWLAVNSARLPPAPSLGSWHGRQLILGVRPSHVREAKVDSKASLGNRLHGTIVEYDQVGPEVLVKLELAGPVELSEEALGHIVQGDAKEAAALRRRRAWNLVALFEPEALVSLGESVEVVVDTHQLHLFDPTTGDAILGRT